MIYRSQDWSFWNMDMENGENKWTESEQWENSNKVKENIKSELNLKEEVIYYEDRTKYERKSNINDFPWGLRIEKSKKEETVMFMTYQLAENYRVMESHNIYLNAIPPFLVSSSFNSCIQFCLAIS